MNTDLLRRGRLTGQKEVTSRTIDKLYGHICFWSIVFCRIKAKRNQSTRVSYKNASIWMGDGNGRKGCQSGNLIIPNHKMILLTLHSYSRTLFISVGTQTANSHKQINQWHIPNTLDLESQKAQSYFMNSNSHINLSNICPFHFQCTQVKL